MVTGITIHAEWQPSTVPLKRYYAGMPQAGVEAVFASTQTHGIPVASSHPNGVTLAAVQTEQTVWSGPVGTAAASGAQAGQIAWSAQTSVQYQGQHTLVDYATRHIPVASSHPNGATLTAVQTGQTVWSGPVGTAAAPGLKLVRSHGLHKPVHNTRGSIP